MDHRIVQSRDYWDRLAQSDPMWAILSDPAKKNRQWDLRDFMANGEGEIALLWHRLEQLHIVPARSAALDFGCGIGRLTQALARRFDHVTGVDISPSMTAVARNINRYPLTCEYVCSDRSDLADLPAGRYDLIYSNIVLQHIVPELSLEYLEAFFRLLKPAGVLVFQLPSHREGPSEGMIHPMPDEAYQAGIELTAPIPTNFATSQLLAVVRIRNTSGHEWRQRECGSIRVGNHWLDSTGRYMVIQDDGRATLPQILRPGESCNVVLPVNAPSIPGSYQGEIDLVHERITWFRDKGSRTVRFDVQVRGRTPDAEPRASSTVNELPIPDYPDNLATVIAGQTKDEGGTDLFPMHGVPREQVIAVIEQHGGTLVHLEDGLRAGLEWVDYRYFIRAATR